VMINAEQLCDTARVIDVGDGTTSRVRDPTPEFECGAHDLVTLFDEQPRRHRGVHSPTHRHENFHLTILPVRRVI